MCIFQNYKVRTLELTQNPVSLTTLEHKIRSKTKACSLSDMTGEEGFTPVFWSQMFHVNWDGAKEAPSAMGLSAPLRVKDLKLEQTAVNIIE